MNQFSLKITGAAALAEQLDATQDLDIQASLSIYEVAKRDLQDGNFEIVYKTKIVSAVECKQKDRAIKGKDRTKASQRLRFALMERARELGRDPEEFYQSEMNKIISTI